MINIFALAVAVFAVGGLLILAASRIPGFGASARDLWPFYRSEFLIVGAILLPSAAGSWVLLALLLALSLRGQWEIFALFGRDAGTAFGIAALAAGMALTALGMTAFSWLPLSVLVLALIVFALARFDVSRSGPAMASLIFPALAVALLGTLRTGDQGFLWLLLAQAAVETNDAFALLIGKLIGRRRIFPRLSPGKTLAGLVGGLAAGLVAGLAVAILLLRLTVPAAIAVTVTVLMAGLAGDLLLSGLKRRLGEKDFPPVMLLHGGVLDIYDSLLFAAPALLLLRAILRI